MAILSAIAAVAGVNIPVHRLAPHAVFAVPVSASGDVTPPGWIASRLRVEIGADAPAVEVELALAPDHAGQRPRYESAAALAVNRFNEWFGPCPCERLTIVDAAWNRAIDRDTRSLPVVGAGHWLSPPRGPEPERSILVAMADQWWIPVFAPGDRAFARALARYAASRILAEDYPNASYTARFFGGHVPMVFRAIPLGQADHLGSAGDPVSDIARWLLTAERYFGWPALQTVLISYARAHRTSPGSARDFQQLFEDITGRDLGWFFDEIGSGRTLDFAVRAVTVEPAGQAGRPPWRTHVSIARVGDGLFPGSSRATRAGTAAPGAVQIAIDFADGEQVRETWDGRAATWTKSYAGSTRPVAVTVDPEHVLVAERRRVNNSWTALSRRGLVSTGWAGRWMVWLEDCLLGFAALV